MYQNFKSHWKVIFAQISGSSDWRFHYAYRGALTEVSPVTERFGLMTHFWAVHVKHNDMHVACVTKSVCVCLFTEIYTTGSQTKNLRLFSVDSRVRYQLKHEWRSCDQKGQFWLFPESKTFWTSCQILDRTCIVHGQVLSGVYYSLSTARSYR